jgi:hypothetical protein
MYLVWLDVWEKEDVFIVLYYFLRINSRKQITLNSRYNYVGIDLNFCTFKLVKG